MTDVPSPRALFIRFGRFCFRYRNVAFPVVVVALLLIFRPRYPLGYERLDLWVDALGILVAAVGQALRAAVIGYAYILRGGKDRQVYAEDLVTGGLFAHARNPLYFGNLLIFVGLFLIHGNPWALVLGSAMVFMAYSAIVAAEEEYLSARFGAAYTRYCGSVPRWVPRLTGLRETLAGMRFNWKRVVAKEYTSAFEWTAGAVALQVLETLAYHPWRERAATLQFDWTALGVLVLAWGTARGLKKAGRLNQRA